MNKKRKNIKLILKMIYNKLLMKQNHKNLHSDKVPLTLKLKPSKKKQSKKDFNLSYRQLKSSNSYNAFEDSHTIDYFRKISVQKNMKHLLKAFEELPKKQSNKKMINSMVKLIQEPHQNQQFSKVTIDKRKNYTISQNQQISGSLFKNEQKYSPYLSPIRPMTLSKRDETVNDKKLRVRSNINLPQLAQLVRQESNNKGINTKYFQAKTNRGKIFNKSMQKIHKYKHDEFVDFLNKRKSQLQQNRKKNLTIENHSSQKVV